MEAIGLLDLLILILIAGVALWLVNRFVPMEPNVKSLLNAVVVIVLAIIFIVWLFGWLGIEDTEVNAR